MTLGVGVGLCVAAFWFELSRARGGNALSWAYVVEWPLLAGFAVYIWWRVLHPGEGRRERREPVELAPEVSTMLHAWEEHQRDLRHAQSADLRSPDDDTGL